MKTLNELSKLHNLKIIRTTRNANGYPYNEGYALIGFNNLKEAEKIADENEMSICLFTKRNGWTFWYADTDANFYELINFHKRYTGRDGECKFTTWTNKDATEYYDREVKFQLSDLIETAESLDEIESFVVEHREILNQIKNLKDGELLAYNPDNGDYFQDEENSMSWEYDSKYYAIGIY